MTINGPNARREGRYHLAKRANAERWHLEGEYGRAACGVALVGVAPVVYRTTSDLVELGCDDCLAILTGKASA